MALLARTFENPAADCTPFRRYQPAKLCYDVTNGAGRPASFGFGGDDASREMTKRSQIIEEIQGIFKIDGVSKATASIAGDGFNFSGTGFSLCVLPEHH